MTASDTDPIPCRRCSTLVSYTEEKKVLSITIQMWSVNREIHAHGSVFCPSCSLVVAKELDPIINAGTMGAT